MDGRGAQAARSTIEAGPPAARGAPAGRPASARACLACGSTGARPIHPGVTPNVRCRCGLVFVDPLPPREAVLALEDEAFEGNLRDETYEMFEAYYRGYREDPVVQGFRTALARLHALTGGGRLLDVGVGTGLMLHLATQAGFEALGVEISPGAARRAQQEFGVEVRVGDFESLALDAPVDAITMADVLEHTHDPRRTLRHAVSLLRPGGVLFVAVPNHRSTLFRAADLMIRVPRLAPMARRIYADNHYYHFTPRTLDRVLREEGFEVVALSGESPYLGRYRFPAPVKLGLAALIAAGRLTGLEARVEAYAVRPRSA